MINLFYLLRYSNCRNLLVKQIIFRDFFLKCYVCYLAKPRQKTQNEDKTILQLEKIISFLIVNFTPAVSAITRFQFKLHINLQW